MCVLVDQLYQLRTETGHEPVTGIRMEPFPYSLSSTEIKYLILVTTPRSVMSLTAGCYDRRMVL